MLFTVPVLEVVTGCWKTSRNRMTDEAHAWWGKQVLIVTVLWRRITSNSLIFTHPSWIQSPLTVYTELVLVLSLRKIHYSHKVLLTAVEKQPQVTFIQKTLKCWIKDKLPSVERDLGGPVVKRARHKDFLGGTCPPEHCGSGMRQVFTVAVEVLLPRQELLYVRWSLWKILTSSVREQHFLSEISVVPNTDVLNTCLYMCTCSKE